MKIRKAQTGTIITSGQDWTSEDLDNPVYSKKKLLSIKELQQLLDRLKSGLLNFDKMMKTGYLIARLAPGPIGLATDLIDAGVGMYDLYNNKSGYAWGVDGMRLGTNLLARKFKKARDLANITSKYGADIADDIGATIFEGYNKLTNGIDLVMDTKLLVSEKLGGIINVVDILENKYR